MLKFPQFRNFFRKVGILSFSLVIALVVFVGITVVYAVGSWQEPNNTPPRNNVDTPINISGASQIKAGGLAVNASGYDSHYGFVVGNNNGVGGIKVTGNSLFEGSATFQNKVKISDGTQGLNKVLTADATGLASWKNISELPGGNYWVQTGSILYSGNTGWNVGIGTTSPAYKLDVSGTMRASRYYDDNINFYIDANVESRMNQLYASIVYDRDNPAYYADLSGTSRMGYGVFDNVYGYGWMQAGIFYDANDNNYYVDPSATSHLNTGTFNQVCLSGVCRSSWPPSSAVRGGFVSVPNCPTNEGGDAYVEYSIPFTTRTYSVVASQYQTRKLDNAFFIISWTREGFTIHSQQTCDGQNTVYSWIAVGD